MNIERTKFVRRQTLSLASHTVVGGDHDSPDVQILQINAMFSKGPAEEFIDKAKCSFCLRQGHNTSPHRNPSEQDNSCKCVTSTNMRSYHQCEESLTVSTLAAPHMISIISNDQLKFLLIFKCLMPCTGPIHNVDQKSVANAKDIRKSEKKCIDFAWEGRTSMSPRSNEKHTFF